jgi:GntR family transcriptional regulator
MANRAKHPISVKPLPNTPLTEQARTALLEAILDKHFHGRLPPEAELAEMLNVSRTTIRSALQSLEEHGVITRKRAVGTTINPHVRPSTLALERLLGFDRLLREKGHHVDVEVQWSRGSAPADAAEQFGLDPDESYLLTEKRYVASGALAILIRDIIPWDSLTTDRFKRPLPASVFDFSRQYCRRPIDHVLVEIVAMTKRTEETTSLPVDVGDPFCRLHEMHYPASGDPVAFSIIDVDNDVVRFEVFRRG